MRSNDVVEPRAPETDSSSTLVPRNKLLPQQRARRDPAEDGKGNDGSPEHPLPAQSALALAVLLRANAGADDGGDDEGEEAPALVSATVLSLDDVARDPDLDDVLREKEALARGTFDNAKWRSSRRWQPSWRR